ncbi:NitT/TauT family transport system substrate-binding protein/sulfonate transport system substrate-binding protein [Stella humosa]|uniref:Putative aliphatic sulfonates-binding protein n=1 Tax=Stella humosa TaxID=94 RepID=A0A3N1KSX9_9PROT|nr:aliphatic sulfonate ABC transporter substrate-binding protein [Stella humosa]ROP81368.1 NitT/TauT family transport system substrate-binding protein/sulfonate transport system substrate-binding protein [Stella humosa]BBK32719.1 sulfonate ABC transporter substrate-binding protein [Stella humosa]
MTSRRAFLGAAAGALVMAGGLSRPASAAGLPGEFRIGYQKEGVLAVVKQRGGLETRLAGLGVPNVRWVEFSFGPPMMEALGSGAIDLASVGDTPPVFAQAAGANVVYVASTPAAENAIVVPAGSPVSSLAELKGRKVAMARGSSSHNFTFQALKKVGLTFDDITPVFLGQAEASQAMGRGEVDAWAIWDPYFALAELRQGARAIATSATHYPSNSFYLASRVFSDRYGALLGTVIDELRLAYVWADQNRAQAATLIAQATGVEPAAQERTLMRLGIELKPMDEAVIAQQQAIADVFHGLGLIARPIVVRDAVWRQSAAR